jgi:hypothetical protein
MEDGIRKPTVGSAAGTIASFERAAACSEEGRKGDNLS